MKKIILLALVIVSLSSKAQFAHSAGAGFVILSGTGESLSVPSFFYSPRFGVMEFSENMNLSVGSHVGLGFNFQSRSDGSSNSFLNFQLPVLAELNFGHKSTMDNEDGFGFFIGAGGAMNYAAISGGSATSIGPMGNAGVKFKVADYDLGLRFAYLKDVSSDKIDCINLNLIYNF